MPVARIRKSPRARISPPVHYNDLTRAHFEHPLCSGELSGAAVRRGAAGSRAHGTWVQFDVQIDPHDPQQRVSAVRFLAYGCPHVIAVADWVAKLTG